MVKNIALSICISHEHSVYENLYIFTNNEIMKKINGVVVASEYVCCFCLNIEEKLSLIESILVFFAIKALKWNSYVFQMIIVSN